MFPLSIRKRLILSNIAMILIPGALLLIAEIVLGYLLFVVFNGNPQGDDLKVFVQFRFIAIALILIDQWFIDLFYVQEYYQPYF